MSRSIGEHIRCPEGTLINGRFKVIREIGCGNFAKVYKCTDVQHPSATPVAVKILKKEYAQDAAFEADILKNLGARDSRGHKVIRMLDQFTWSRCPCFVFGLRGASLRSRKMGVARGHLSMEDIRKFAKEMIETLAFLHHDVRMVHTDLKPENILIDDEVLTSPSGIGSGWTIADFGSASFYNPAKPDSDLISTRPYRAPEVVLAMPWSTKADIFSMGCILFELFYGARLFEVNEDQEHLALFEKRISALPLSLSRQSKHFRRFFDDRGALLRSSSVSAYSRSAADTVGSRHLSELVNEPELRDMLMQMLEVDPSRRATAQDLLRHAFLTGAPSRSAAVSPLRSQLERMSLGEIRNMPSAAPVSSAKHYIPDKENAPRQTSKISPAVPSLGFAAAAPSGTHSAPASARIFGAAPAPSRLSYAALRQHTGVRDMPAAGMPSSNITPRYAVGGSRW